MGIWFWYGMGMIWGMVLGYGLGMIYDCMA